MYKEPLRSPQVLGDLSSGTLSWLQNIKYNNKGVENWREAVSFSGYLCDITLIVEITGACPELAKLHNLDIKREWTYACHKEGFVKPPNG